MSRRGQNRALVDTIADDARRDIGPPPFGERARRSSIHALQRAGVIPRLPDADLEMRQIALLLMRPSTAALEEFERMLASSWHGLRPTPEAIAADIESLSEDWALKVESARCAEMECDYDY